MTEKAKEASTPLYIAFIDYKKAFDSVKRTRLWNIPRKMGINEQNVRVLQRLYEGQQASVRVDGSLSDWFAIEKGVRQGCLVSPVSFNCYSEHIMRESADDLTWIGVTFSGHTINNLRYADDIVLIAQSPQALQTLLNKVEAISREYGLEINTKKTQVMAITPQKKRITISDQGNVLEQVETFKYLGAIIAENGECSTENPRETWDSKRNSEIPNIDSLWKDRSL